MPKNDYNELKKIGNGAFGDAFLVELKKDRSQKFVMKKMQFKYSEEKQEFLAEVDMLRQLSHCHIVGFHESYSDRDTIYLIMENCAKGDMLQFMKCQSNYLSEALIVHWTIQILSALQYLHGRSKPILHRDLKPGNIFLTDDYVIKLGDFGISRELAHFGDLATTIAGTPLYLSPEIFRQEPYDHKCDIWSLGCCIYEMMTFKLAVNPLLLAVLNIPSINPMPTNYTQDLVDLVTEMVTVDPKCRPTAADASARLIQIKISYKYPDNPKIPQSAAVANVGANGSCDDDDDDPTIKVPAAGAAAAAAAAAAHVGIVDSLVLYQQKKRGHAWQTNDHSDGDDTLKDSVNPVWTPERVLRYYGYRFNKKGELRDMKTNERFKYDIGLKKDECELRYQKIAKAVTSYVYEVLEGASDMQRIYLPLDHTAGEPWSFIYATFDVFSNPDKLLILVGGSEPVRAGVWSRKAIINDSIPAGSQIPYVDQARREGYAVLLLNQNLTYYEVDGVKIKIRENEDSMNHTLYVWDNVIIKNTKVKKIAFVTHTYGGTIVSKLAAERMDSFQRLVFGVAFCHHQHTDLTHKSAKPVAELFSTISATWNASERPLDESLAKKPSAIKNLLFAADNNPLASLSAGENRPEWTPYTAKDSIFKFLREKYLDHVQKDPPKRR